MIGFPYTYGDISHGSINKPIFARKNIGKFLAILAIALIPTISNASEVISVPVQLVLTAAPIKTSTAIGPVSAICCAGAGVCAKIAVDAQKIGNMKAATAAACGALTLCCAQRVAESYSL